MNFVKATPLLRGQRAKDGMVKHAGLRAKPPFNIGERCIHGNERVVEMTNRIVAQTGFRPGLFRRFDSAWKPADSKHVEAPKVLASAGG
jgi:hypothetical protein